MSANKSEGVVVSFKEELEPGMKLSQELHTKNGIVLLPTGQVLSDTTIKRIRELSETVESPNVMIEKSSLKG